MKSFHPLIILTTWCSLVLLYLDTAKGCAEMDLVVMMDDTGGELPRWKRAMFLKNVVDLLEGSKAHFALTNFQKLTSTIMDFEDPQDADTIKAALDDSVTMTIQQDNRRNTANAFQSAHDDLFKTGVRDSARKVALLITHGRTGMAGKNRRKFATYWAGNLRDKLGVELYVVGIAGRIEVAELNGFAGDADRVMVVDSYDALTDSAAQVKDWICGTDGTTTESLPSYVSTECAVADEIDVVAMIPQTVEYRTGLFVQQLTETFNVGPNDTQVGLVYFDQEARRFFKLDAFPSALGVRNRVADAIFSSRFKANDQVGTWSTRLAAAGLKYTRERMFCKNGGGRDASGKALVAVLDKKPSSSDLLLAQAKALKDLGVVIIAVATDPSVSAADLKVVATSDAHSFRVNGPEELDTIVADVSRTLCTQKFDNGATGITQCDAGDDDDTDGSSTGGDTDEGVGPDTGTGTPTTPTTSCLDTDESAEEKELWCKLSAQLKKVFRSNEFTEWYTADQEGR